MIQSLMKWAARATCRAPLPLLRALSGPPIVIDGQSLDPLVQFLVRNFGKPERLPQAIEKVRRQTDEQGCWLTHAPAPDMMLRPWAAKTPGGTISCEVHRRRDLKDGSAPALVFFHGGGHIAGSLKSHRDVCRQLAHQSGCVVIAVSYRLAPEHRFPAGIQDALSAYDAIARAAAELGIDPDRLAVGGDSAGGNVAAVLAQQRRGAPHGPKLQMLWAPWLDMSQRTQSYSLFGHGFLLEAAGIDWYKQLYLNSPAEAFDPKVSPALGDVHGVCAAAVMVAGFDPFRDEGIAYAAKLRSAGVAVHLKVYEGLVHPFLSIAGCVPAAGMAFDEACAILRSHL